MREILAGDGFNKAVIDLGLSAEKKWGNQRFEVWSINNADIQALIDVPGGQWKEEWGWWRFAKGSNISHYPTHIFKVNGKEFLGYHNSKEKYFGREFSSLTDYLCNVIGVSTERNICAIAVDLAKINNVTMAELFAKYEG